MSDSELRKRAISAREKVASLGPDVDIGSYSGESEDHADLAKVEDLPKDDKEQMREVGIKEEIEERSGTFIQIDDSVVFSEALEEGVEILEMAQALEKYDWLREYWWKAVPVDTDKYTAAVELDYGGGYFIRAKKGYNASLPVQSCLYLSTDSLSQTVHNIVIVEEDAQLHVITGCANSRDLGKALHMGVSEFYVKEGGKLSFTMIHNWKRDLAVRPRSNAIVDRGGVLISNYICLKPAGSLQMYPTVYLKGTGAVTRLYSLLLASPGSELDVGGRVYLQGEGSRAEIVSRAVSTGGRIISRGDIVGEAPGVKGHLECDGLLISDDGSIHAVPELQGQLADVELSHEAAVGKVSQEEIEYLMARGLSADEATATIVRGFLDVKIEGLPDELSSYIEQIIRRSEQEGTM
jgi:hypothetical protein